jgi:hypothetical protein
MMIRPALLLASLLVACAAPPERIPLASRLAPEGLTAEQTTALLAAADDWWIATAGTVDLTTGVGQPLPVRLGLPDSEHACAETIFEADGSIHIDVDAHYTANMATRYASMWQYTFEHELGHALGLEHVPHTLMEPGRTHEQGACVDAESLARVCANYGGCNVGAHATCPP